MIYVYDGTYFGFLSAVYANYYDKRAVEVISSDLSPGVFLDEHQDILTNNEKAKRVEKALYEKCGADIVNGIYYAFHSKEREKDTWLLRYIEIAFRMGKMVENALSEPVVMHVVKLAQRVGRECHVFLGFVRFEEILYGQQSYLYCKIEPENDLLELMGTHFAGRFYNEKIVIHDIRRKIALIAYQGKWEVCPFTLSHQQIEENRSVKEDNFRRLWQGYFEHIAIDERKSAKRQKHFVPYKYRKNLTEFQIMK